MRKLRNISRAVGLAIAASLAVASVAQAHIGVKPDSTAAGGYALAWVTVPHGCDDAPTTAIRLQVPENLLSITPGRTGTWTPEATIVALDEPVTGPHGEEVTERTSEVTWTASAPLPDGQLDMFPVSVRWPDDAAGETMVLPMVQECEGGASTEWTEVPVEGEEEPEHPAPTVMITEADGDGHGHDSADKDEHGDDAMESDDADESSDDDSDSDTTETVAWIGVGLGGLALIIGIAGWSRGRK